MRVWTLQSMEVWDELCKNGNFVCDETKVEYLKDRNFVKAYDWLIARMEERIGKRPEGISYPIWAWHSWKGNNKKPDLRRYEFQVGKKGEKYACIELEILVKNSLRKE